MKSALGLQRDLGLNVGTAQSRRVDVFECIVRSGAILMFKPMDRLLGAFMKPGGTAGIILNTERPLGMQRFTAAHELGHLVLGHEPQADDEDILKRVPIASDRRWDVSHEEREADAFASYFILPPYLMRAQMDVQGWTRRDFENPEIVYQASLRFGASYAGTVYALEREKVIDAELRRALLKTKPINLKRALLGDFELERPLRTDVWHLTEKDEGGIIEAGRTDLFLLRLSEDSGAGYVWTFDRLEASGLVILKDGHESAPDGLLGSATVRRVLVQAAEPLATTLQIRECRPWDPGDDPQTLTLHCRTATSDEAGLFEPQRRELLAAS